MARLQGFGVLGGVGSWVREMAFLGFFLATPAGGCWNRTRSILGWSLGESGGSAFGSQNPTIRSSMLG